MSRRSIVIGLIVVLVAAGLGIWLGFFPPWGGEPGEILIGHLAPLTGTVAVYGDWLTQGTELAAEEINTKGGIDGRKIRIIHEDTKCDPTTGVSAINKLITVDKVPAIIGAACSSVTLAVAPIAERNKVALMSAVSAAIKISDAGDYIFRIFPSNAAEAKKLVELAQSLNLTKAAILSSSQ